MHIVFEPVYRLPKLILNPQVSSFSNDNADKLSSRCMTLREVFTRMKTDLQQNAFRKLTYHSMKSLSIFQSQVRIRFQLSNECLVFFVPFPMLPTCPTLKFLSCFVFQPLQARMSQRCATGVKSSTPPPHLCDCELRFSSRVFRLLDSSARVQLQTMETEQKNNPSIFF